MYRRCRCREACKVIKWVKIFKTEKKHPIRPTEVCGKVEIEKNGQKSVKTLLLLPNVIDADHQNCCLFTKAILHHLYGF